MRVREDHIKDMKALIDTGDLKLVERRSAFRQVVGRDTTLNDEQLIAACAATDDNDEELFAENVKIIEGAGYITYLPAAE